MKVQRSRVHRRRACIAAATADDNAEARARLARARSLAKTWAQVNSWQPGFNPFAAIHAQLLAVPAEQLATLVPAMLQSPSSLRGLWSASAWLYDNEFHAQSELGYRPSALHELYWHAPADWNAVVGLPLLPPLRHWRIRLRQQPRREDDGGEHGGSVRTIVGRARMLQRLWPDTFLPLYFQSETRRRCFSSGEDADVALDFDCVSSIRAEDVLSLRSADGTSAWPLPRSPVSFLAGTRLYLRPLAPSILIGKAWRFESPHEQRPGSTLCHVLLVRLNSPADDASAESR